MGGKRGLIPPPFHHQHAADTWIIQGNSVEQASVARSDNVDQLLNILSELTNISGEGAAGIR